jgi:PhnB protein
MSVKPIPEGFHSMTPYLGIQGATEAIEFYKRAFGAVETFRLEGPGGTIGHAELRIGDSPVMLADACPEAQIRSPAAIDGSSVGLHLYVDDVDTVFARAVAAGGQVLRPVQDQFYGDRTGAIQDPFGHVWFIATHREDLTHDEIRQRAVAMFGQREQ